MDYQKILTQLQEGSRSQRRRKEQLDKEKKDTLAALQKRQQGKAKNAEEKIKAQQKLQDTIAAQLRYAAKIKQGNANSMRTFGIRIFFLKFYNKPLATELKSVEELMQTFQEWLQGWEKTIETKNEKEEQKAKTALKKIIIEYEKEKKKWEQRAAKEKELRDKATMMLAILLLTATILLFKETKEVAYDAEIFGEKNRWNPLNPFFPLRA